MKELELTLENLRELDFGKISAAFGVELAHVVRDCIDRPADDRARKVVITFLVAPSQDTTGRGHPGDTVNVGAEIASAVPKRRSQVYSMKPRVNGSISFHPDSPDDPNANKLYDNVDTETGEVKD